MTEEKLRTNREERAFDAGRPATQAVDGPVRNECTNHDEL